MATTRTAPTAEPAPRPHRWPPFLVTAAHAVPSGPTSPDAGAPYGLWHARTIGSLQTACGMPAVTWHYFWSLRFHQAGARACPDCTRIVLGI